MTSVFGRWAAAAAVFAGVAFALVPNEAEAWAWVQAWADHTSQTFYVGDTPCFSWWFNSDGTGASYKSWSLDKGTRSWKYGDSYIYKDSGEDGSNNQWETTGIQVTSSGTWYYSLWLGWGNSVGDNGHYYNYASGSWSEGSSSVITSTFTVNALNNPTAGTLTPSKNQIVVNWTKGTSGVAKDTLVVRSTSSTKPTPVGGTEYNAGDTIGTGYTVVYRGGDTSVTDTGLSAGTTYYYYFFAENYKYYSSGVSKSAKTLAVPTAGTPSAGSITASGATVTLGSINMGGAASTAVTFQYGTSTSYGSTVTPSPSSFASTITSGSTTATLSSLAAGTTYYYKWTISNSAGSVTKTGSFTTLPNAPTVTAGATTVSSLTFTPGANGNGTATTYKYYCGTSSSGTPSTTCTAGTAVPVSGLEPNTTYYVIVQATAGGNTATSSATTITTASPAAGQLVDWLSTAASGAWVNASTYPWYYNTSAVNWKNVTDFGAQHVRVNNNNQPAQTLSANTTVASLTYGSAATSAHTLSGSYTLTVNGGLTNSAAATQTISSAVALGANTTANVASGGDLVLSGVVSGAKTLTKSGAGTLTLGGANTYSGATTVSAGTLAVSNATALGTAAATVASGATLKLTPSSAATVANALTVNGGTISNALSANTLSGAVTLGANSTVGTATALTMSGGISGSYGITKTGAGTLTLSGAKTYTGTTTINEGIVSIDNATSLGTTAGGTTINSGGTLELNPTEAIKPTEPITLAGGTITNKAYANQLKGDISLTAASTIQGNTTYALSTYGNITGTGSLTVNGLKYLYVYGTNTYTGGTTVNVQYFVIANTGEHEGDVTVNSGKYFYVTKNSGVSWTYSGVLSGKGGLLKTGAGELVLEGANTFTGAISHRQGVLTAGNTAALGSTGEFIFYANANNKTLRFAVDDITLSRPVTWNSTGGTAGFSVDSGMTATLNGVISGSGTGTLTKNGAGTLVLGGANTYTAPTTVSEGTLKLTGTAASSAFTVAGGILEAGAADRTVASLTMTSGGIKASTANTFKSTTGAAELTGGTVYFDASGWTKTGDSATWTIFTGASAPTLGAGLEVTLASGTSASEYTLAASGNNVIVKWEKTTTAPTVQSPTVAGIGSTSATLGATVTADGNATITSYGVYCGTATGPTSGGFTVSGAPTVGTAYSQSVSLTANTLYYYRGFAINSKGSGYSTEGTFRTTAATPAVPTGLTITQPGGTTSLVITPTAASGYVVLVMGTSDPTTAPTARRTYTAASQVYTSATDGLGGKIVYAGAAGSAVTVTGLTPGTRYYVRAYAYAGNDGSDPTDASHLNGLAYSSAKTANGYTLAEEPTKAPVGKVYASTNTALRIRFCGGNGDLATVTNCLVVAYESASTPTYTAPTDGQAYEGNLDWTSATTTLGTGKVVYSGAMNAYSSYTYVWVTNLTRETRYYFAVYPYTVSNGAAATVNYGTVLTFNGYTLADTPTAPTAFKFSNATTNTLKLSATRGTGTSGTMYTTFLLSTETALGATPTNGSAYTPANVDFTASGSDVAVLGNGKVVYVGSAASPAATVTNLTPGTHYYAWAYARAGASPTYAYSAAAAADGWTLATEPTTAPGLTVGTRTTNTITLSYTMATTGNRLLIVGYTADSFTAPTDGAVSSAVTSGVLDYTTAGTLGSAKVIRSAVTANGSVTITNLNPATTYYFRAYAYNVANSQGATANYYATYTAANATTLATEPTGAPQLTFSSRTTTSLTYTITKGTGSTNTLVQISTGSTFTAPTDATTYTADNTGPAKGTRIDSKGYVVYATNGTSVTVSGLTPGTRYYFAAYAYNGTGSNENYYATAGTANTYTVPNAPTVAAVADGKTMVRLTATKSTSGTTTGMVLVYGGSTTPSAGTAVPTAVGASFAGGTVVWKGTANSGSQAIEHVVAAGATHSYRLFSYVSTIWSAAASKSVSMPAISGGQVETFSYTNGTAISSANWAQPDNGWSGTGWAAWDDSGSYIKIAQPSVRGKGLLNSNYLGQAGGNALWFNGSNDTRVVRAYRGFDSPYTSGKVWFMFTVRNEYAGDADNKSYGMQFMSTAGDSTTIFASVGKPPSRYSSKPRLAVSTSKNAAGLPTTDEITWATGSYNYELSDYGHDSSSGGNGANNTTNCHTVYGYIDLDASPKKIYVSAEYSGTCFTNATWTNKTSFSWEVNGATVTPASTAVAGLALYSTGYCGNTYFDEIRVASTWKGLLGGTADPPGNVTPFTARGDGNELVRLAFTAPDNAESVVIVDKTNSVSTALTSAEEALSSGSAGATAGSAIVAWRGSVTPGTAYEVDCVVKPGTEHKYWAIANGGGATSPAWTAATGTNPVTMGTYESWEKLETFSYTNGTKVSESGNTWTGGQGWGVNYWGNSGSGDWYALKPSQAPSYLSNHVTNYPDSTGNILCVTNLGDNTSATFNRVVEAIGGSQGDTVYFAYRMAYAWSESGKNRWAGLQFVSDTNTVFVGKAGATDHQYHLGINATGASSPCWPNVGSGGAEYELKGLGDDAKNVYLVVGKIQWTATGTANIYANAFYTGNGTASLPESEPSWGSYGYSGATLGPIYNIQFIAGATGGGTIGYAYFDELRWGTSWDQLLAGKAPAATWTDGGRKYRYVGDITTNYVFSQPAGPKQSAYVMISNAVPSTAANWSTWTNAWATQAASATWVTNFADGSVSGQTDTKWQTVCQWTNAGTYYLWGMATGNDTAVYSKDSAPYDKVTNTVTALSAPTLTVTPGDFKETLSWTRAKGTSETGTANGRTFNEVMVVRFSNSDASGLASLKPVDGTAYYAGNVISYDANRYMTVVYRGSDATSFVDAGLAKSNTYYYAAYTVNNSYYSTKSTVASGKTTGTSTTPTVDGNTTDWVGGASATPNSAAYSEEEFIWTDKTLEGRKNTDQCLSADIKEFRVKATASTVYFLLRLAHTNPASVNPTNAYVVVGVDTRRSTTSEKMNWLGDESATFVGGGYYQTNAAIHYPSRQMAVHYVGGSENTWQVEMYADNGAEWYGPSSRQAACSAGGSSDPCIEWSVARSDLGLTGTCTGRFTVATFANSQAWNNQGVGTVRFDNDSCAAVDAMEIVPYGVNDQDGKLGSWDEGLKDGNVNFWADVRFNATGLDSHAAPSAPAAVTGATGAGSPKLAWSASSDTDGFVTGYLLEVATNAAFGASGDLLLYRVNIEGAATTSYQTRTSVSNFYWRVRARDSSGILSGGEAHYYTVTGKTDRDGPVAKLLYVGTNVMGFINNTDGYRDDQERSGDATSVEDSDLQDGGKTFGFVIEWYDVNGVYATNRSRNNGQFAWNILSEHAGGEPYGRVSPNWDLLIVDRKATSKPANETVDGVSIAYTQGTLTVPTESGGTETLTNCWYIDCGKDAVFTNDANVTQIICDGNSGQYMTNYVTNAFSFGGYRDGVELYLTVSAEDSCTQGSGADDSGDAGWWGWPYWVDGSAGSWGDDPRPAVNCSGYCADGPHKARNVTTNQLLKFYVRDNDVGAPTSSTNAWGAVAVNAANEKFTPSLVVATSAVTKAQATAWASIPGKLAPLSGAGRDTVYQLTDEAIGKNLSFLFNVYDTYLHSGLQVGTAATATVGGRTLTNTAFKVLTWDDATANWVAGAENTAKYASSLSTLKGINPSTGAEGTTPANGTGPGTVLVWNFGTVTEASLQSLFGMENILSYIGTNSAGTTNLVQLHAWDCDNNRTGDQAEAELTFGKLMLTDDDATPPQNAGDSLLGTGTNAVEFGTFAEWAKSATGSSSTEFATNKLMKGIVASTLKGYKTTDKGSTWTAASVANTSYLTITNGMLGEAFAATNAYFEFTLEGQNGLNWQAGSMEFKNRRTTTGPTNFAITVRQPTGVKNYPAVSADGTVSNTWTLSGNTQFGKANGLYRFQMTGKASATAALQSPSVTAGTTLTKVSYRVGWYGTRTNADGSAIAGTLTVSAGGTTLATYTSSSFTGTAADGYWLDAESEITTSPAQVTWSATGLTGGSGFLIRDAQLITQNGYADETVLATFTVLAPPAAVVEDTCLAWTNGTWIASGGRRVYRIYGWGATKAAGTWGVNEVQIRGVAKAPTGFEVTDADLMGGSWTNELAVVDGAPTGYDTHKSGICVVNAASGAAATNGPKYVLRYPEAYAASSAGTVASADYTLLGLRKAQVTSLTDTDFAGWTKAGSAAAVTTNKAKVGTKLLKLPANSSVSSIRTNQAIARTEIAESAISGATISGGLSLRSAVASADNEVVVGIAFLDASGNELASSSDSFSGAHVNSWDDVSITPLSVDSASVRTAQISIAQANASGGEVYVDNVNLSIVLWGAEIDLSGATEATKRSYNGDASPGARLHLDLASLSANTEIPLSDDTSAMTGSGSTNYTLVSTVHDYDCDRTNDGLAVTITNAFRLYDDDAVPPQAGGMFGGPLGVSVKGTFSNAKTNAGANLTWTVSDRALAEAGTSALVGFTLNFYDYSGWETTQLMLGSQYIQKDGAKQGNFTQTVSAGAADLASATNAWTISVANLYSAFKSQFSAAKNNTNVLNAIIVDKDADRTGDSLAVTQQVGRVWFTDQDKNPPRFNNTLYKFRSMVVLTNMPDLDTVSASGKAMDAYLTDAHALGGSLAAHAPAVNDTAAGLITNRWFTLTDGDLAAVRADNRLAVLANVYDYPETLAGRANTGLQRGTTQYTSKTAVLDGVATNMCNTFIRWDELTGTEPNPVLRVYDAYNAGWSCTDSYTKAVATNRHTAFVWTNFSRENITTLLPTNYGANGVTDAFRDLCLTVVAYDADCDRGGDQLGRTCYGERIHLRDDDTTPPTKPGKLYPGPGSTLMFFPNNGDGTATRETVFWTNNYNVSNMRFCIPIANISQDLLGTTADANGVADTVASGIKEYRFAPPGVAISTNAGIVAPTNKSSATYYRFYTQDLLTVITNNPGFNYFQLFAVDADDDRDGDALCSEALTVPLGYDPVKPTSVKANSFAASSDTVDDPTSMMALSWEAPSGGMGPDNTADGAPSIDAYSPWESYKVYFTTYESQHDTPSVSDTEVQNVIRGGIATWNFVTATTNTATKTNPKLTSLASSGTTSFTMPDLEPGENYIFAIVGRDKAGNESATLQYAVGDTIKFAVTQGVMRAWATVSNELKTTFGASAFTPSNTASLRATPALYWEAKLNDTTHRANRAYSLLYRDGTVFEEGSGLTTLDKSGRTVSGWGRIAGNSISNNFYAEPDGNAQKLGRGNMRFYRAAYAGREFATNSAVTPLASEEVYALHNVKLSEGRNFVALHGVPYTNTFAGVFGTDTSYWPAGATMADATRVEFFDGLHGTNTAASETYWFGTGGKWYKQNGSSATDVTATKQADNFFTRGFAITLPARSSGFYATNTVKIIETAANGSLTNDAVPVFEWSPILQMPTNDAAHAFTNTVHCGTWSNKLVGRKVFTSYTGVDTYVAFRAPVSIHPSQLGLTMVSSTTNTARTGFVYNPSKPHLGDRLLIWAAATKDARIAGDDSDLGNGTHGLGSTSQMYYDGTDWRWYAGEGVQGTIVGGTPIRPNDAIVIRSFNGGIGNSWKWSYTPTNLYPAADRHFGH